MLQAIFSISFASPSVLSMELKKMWIQIYIQVPIKVLCMFQFLILYCTNCYFSEQSSKILSFQIGHVSIIMSECEWYHFTHTASLN